MTAEFSRPERVDQIGVAERTVTLSAAAPERTALAPRFDLLAIDRLEARFIVRRDEGGILATGRVSAAVTQACVATGAPLAANVDEAVALRFVEQLAAADEEDLPADALDMLPIEGGVIDLGEAAAETMALALDPFPRSVDADAALAAAGVKEEGEEEDAPGPFAALAGLKRTLQGE